jgi:adenosylmethionine-8-amino-7-oxononanoate aminotransferase
MPTTPSPLWYPYAPLAAMRPPLEVVSARGARLRLADGSELIDGVASWWCVLHGYNHPALNEALQDQLGRMAHVMLGGLVHASAERLAAKLVALYPGMQACFFADSGSVGVEVALKMAAQYWVNRGVAGKQRFVALQGGYHGDTVGAMSVGEPDDAMRAAFSGLVPAQRFVPRPDGWPATNLSACLAALEQTLQAHHGELAAFICEPVLQGYGGFRPYDPAYLRGARALCDRYDVLMIFDEVATGFGRTGTLFACEHAGVAPDIAILGKGLSAGYLGLSATLASPRVFEAFWSADPGKAFMHGPTFMGNALACAVALRSADLFFEERRLDDVKRIEAVLRAELGDFVHPLVREVRILGAMAVLETVDDRAWHGLREWAAGQGVWLRPFQRYVYTMPPLVITDEDLRRVCRAMKGWFLR